MICDRCQPIIQNSFPIDPAAQGKRYTILNSGTHFRDSDGFAFVINNFGCHICQSLYRALPRHIAENLSVLDHKRGFSIFELFSPASDGEKLTLSFTYAGASNLPIDDPGKRLDRGHKFFLKPVSGTLSSLSPIRVRPCRLH